MIDHSVGKRWLAAVTLACLATAASAAPLPQDHEYQKVLRSYMATLTAKDFDHGKGDKPQLDAPADTRDQESQYRTLMLNQMIPPMIGSKRGSPSINYPPSRFTLAEIEVEGPDVMVPWIDADSLMSFTTWDYPGNILRDNRGLKLRSFVNSAIRMMMADRHFDANPNSGRADWHAYQLVYFGFAYAGFKDLLPPEVQAAYATGMERYARRLLDWGVKGEEPNLDLITAAALWYAHDASTDENLRREIEGHIRTILSDPRYFHPAGYWVERGGLDLGFGGMANYFAIWSALKGNRDYADDAIARLYRLRSHLILTEPDGTKVGPTHFNSRLGSDPHNDQWGWGQARDYAASQVTDEAAHLVRPTAAAMADAALQRASSSFNGQIRENPSRPGTSNNFMDNQEISNGPWQLRMWYNWNFPVTLNPGYDHYRPGSWARRQSLEKSGSPMLKSPFDRGERFVRDFAQAFFVSHQDGHTAIVHTGPVGRPEPAAGKHEFHGPMGFGGGQLSAFHTPQAGAAILGRRGGQNWDKTFDVVEEWRLWPIHAVTGQTTAGRVFTSARIADPVVKSDVGEKQGSVSVAGAIPGAGIKQDSPAMAGEIGYARTFELGPGGVTVTTTLQGDGKDTIAELYETIPVFHRRDARQTDGPAAAISFQVGSDWKEASPEPVGNVLAVKLARFDGAVEIKFDKPRTVRLSPAEWTDAHMSRALCRTVLVDLLENGGKPAELKGERRLAYTIAPAGRP